MHTASVEYSATSSSLLSSSSGPTQETQSHPSIPDTPGRWIRTTGSAERWCGVVISYSNPQIWDFALVGNPKHQSGKKEVRGHSALLIHNACLSPGNPLGVWSSPSPHISLGHSGQMVSSTCQRPRNRELTTSRSSSPTFGQR